MTAQPIQRLTDSNNLGGKIIDTDGNTTVFANNLSVSVNTSTVLYGPGTTSTAYGSQAVFAHNVPVNYTSNNDADLAVRIGGSGNVFVGDDIDQDVPSVRVVVEFDEEDVFNPGGGEAAYRNAVRTGVISSREAAVSAPAPTGKANTEPSRFTGTPTADCGGIESIVDPPLPAPPLRGASLEALSLSPRFTVGKLTRKPNVVFDNPLTDGAAELSVAEIVCNLKLLSINCLEPIFNKFPNAFVTNTWRPRGSSSATSQHPKGQAADIQLRGVPKSAYFEAAQWIKDNVSFDQLLLEYKTTGSGLPWLHVSFNKSGNRKQVMTFLNDRRYAMGLTDLASTV
jgi:hypothetical protein